MTIIDLIAEWTIPIGVILAFVLVFVIMFYQSSEIVDSRKEFCESEGFVFRNSEVWDDTSVIVCRNLTDYEMKIFSVQRDWMGRII